MNDVLKRAGPRSWLQEFIPQKPAATDCNGEELGRKPPLTGLFGLIFCGGPLDL